MSSKTKIRIYRTVINEVSREYENSREFIHNKLNEQCSEHGISAEEVRLYIFICLLCYVHSLATYTVYSEFLALK